jgi:hypothetical protein
MELYCIKCPLTVQSECDIKPVINNITDDKNVCVSVNVTLTMILTHVCESVNVTLTMILTNSVKHTVMF